MPVSPSLTLIDEGTSDSRYLKMCSASTCRWRCASCIKFQVPVCCAQIELSLGQEPYLYKAAPSLSAGNTVNACMHATAWETPFHPDAVIHIHIRSGLGVSFQALLPVSDDHISQSSMIISRDISSLTPHAEMVILLRDRYYSLSFYISHEYIYN